MSKEIVISTLVNRREKRVNAKLDGAYKEGMLYSFKNGKDKFQMGVPNEYPYYEASNGQRLVFGYYANTTPVTMYGDPQKDYGSAIMAIHKTHIAVDVVKKIQGGSDSGLMLKIGLIIVGLIVLYYFGNKFLFGGSNTGGGELTPVETEPQTRVEQCLYQM